MPIHGNPCAEPQSRAGCRQLQQLQWQDPQPYRHLAMALQTSYKAALSRIRECQFEALFILGYTVLQALFVSSDIRTLAGVTTSPSELN
jgi:hypothetical protein